MAFFSIAAQGRARQLDFGDARSQLATSAVFSFSPLADALQVVGQIEERVERDQALRLEDPDHVLDHLVVRRRMSPDRRRRPAGR